LRACWTDQSISFKGRFATVEAMAMAPKPAAAGGPPIWVGGNAPAALKRAGTLGDGWLANAGAAPDGIATVKHHAERAGRDPEALGFQAQLSAPPRQGDQSGRDFYADLDAVAVTAAQAAAAGFGWATINATGVFIAGARRGAQLGEALAAIHDRLRREVG
ncbi:MAG: LLM class flavin-dependent oxidoreductase, partial [Dehalococcoidia bacterium]